jgi:hypothetical protein
MNRNYIITDTWSNEGSRRLYESNWPDEEALRVARETGEKQCGGCAFFAPFNSDWGLCANVKSRHHLETVFEHFACPSFINEGWGPHSFTSDTEFHCRCGGTSSEDWDKISEMLKQQQKPLPGGTP